MCCELNCIVSLRVFHLEIAVAAPSTNMNTVNGSLAKCCRGGACYKLCPNSVIAVTSPLRWEAVGEVRIMLHPCLPFPASVFVVLASWQGQMLWADSVKSRLGRVWYGKAILYAGAV